MDILNGRKLFLAAGDDSGFQQAALAQQFHCLQSILTSVIIHDLLFPSCLI